MFSWVVMSATLTDAAVSRADFALDPGQEVGIIGELRGVLQGQPGGAVGVSGDDQRRDLDDLTLAAGGRAGVLLRAGDVALAPRRASPPFAAMTASRACSIAFVGMRHGGSVGRGADRRLTSR